MFQAHYGYTKTFVNSFILEQQATKSFQSIDLPLKGNVSIVGSWEYLGLGNVS